MMVLYGWNITGNNMLGKFEKIDRRTKEPKLEPIDAIMLTLDAEKYLEETLDATYQEIPINNFYVLDGGSKDDTLKILKKYPRMKIMVKPEIKTTGKGFEILFKMVKTPWVVFVDNAKVPAKGWYDEMIKYKDKYDFYGSKRIVHYEFEREDPTTSDIDKRPLGGPWMINMESVKNYHVDDDYAWRIVDLILRQEVEKNGYKYGAVSSTHHICYITDQEKYTSDDKKKGVTLIFKPPEVKVLNKENWERRIEITSKAIVKYLDPQLCQYFCNDRILLNLSKLDMKWVKETNSEWFNLLKHWKRRRYIRAKMPRWIYSTYKKIKNKAEEIVDELAKKYDV
jgi:glycosyltransferase involved in cell wall biosynthesis